MSRFIIQPHGRLQEIVAHENGYFEEEGLDYEISDDQRPQQTKKVESAGNIAEIRSGAYQSYEAGMGNKGEKSDVP